MRDAFSAIRSDMVTKDDLRDELSRFATKDDLNALRNEVRADIADLGRDFAARLLESEGRTRVLIEDLVARITTRREGSPPAN